MSSAAMAGEIAMTDHISNAPGAFLLGVGAQKAGTSWLHKQLHSRPDADFLSPYSQQKGSRGV